MNTVRTFFGCLTRGIKDFGQDITIIINSVLLSTVYFLGVGITSFVARLIGKHFLDTKWSKKKSYWSDLNLKKKPIEDYYRQF